MAEALAKREDLESEIETIIDFVMSTFGDKTAAEVLDEAGVDDTWRTEAEKQCSSVARDFIETDAFGAWLDKLLAD